VTHLSEELKELEQDIRKETLSKEAYKAYQKSLKEKQKQKAKAEKKAQKNTENTDRAIKDKRLFVVDFEGDVQASAVENLREEITAILSVAEPEDEVLVRLESAGGMVHTYGLAASQLKRIKQQQIKLNVAVDEVAASGGYMMACVADKILAAPFAIIGSIGVVGQLPNFNRLLKHNKVDFEQHTAGEFKRTLTMFGENTDKAREKFKQELEETHGLFKAFIAENRSSLDVDKVATGEHWYGTQALELGLIDEITTSDDFIVRWAKEHSVFKVKYEIKKPLSERLPISLTAAIQNALLNAWQRGENQKLFK
jgi:serine protease SohB